MGRVLLTGASGFLGKIIKHYNSKNIITLGRSKAMDIVCDLSIETPVLPDVDVVIHAAGKAHSSPKTKTEINAFFDVNVGGTRNLLDALTRSNFVPRSFILISTVAVYGLDKGDNICENQSLSASDPYGLSKIIAERLVKEWCEKNGVICSILRLPLVAGPNPPGNLKAMINGINRGYYLNIAGGKAKKSMVLAEDVAKIIDSIALIGGTFNLSDGYNPSFAELADSIAIQLGKPKPRNVPVFLARFMAKLGDVIGPKSPFNSKKLSKMTSNLTFDDLKARQIFGWNPSNVLDGFRINK